MTGVLIAIVLAFVAAISGCSDSTTYKFKLTLVLKTPNGTKSGFSEVQVTTTETLMPRGGISTHYTGEAAYIDLGEARPPLIMLLTKHKPNFVVAGAILAETMFSDDPQSKSESYIRYMDRISKRRDKRDAPLDKLPILVTFRDVSIPGTVVMIDPTSPENIENELGAGISLNTATFEFIEPQDWFSRLVVWSTSGEIERRLPWLRNLRRDGGHLNGQRVEWAGAPLAGRLQDSDFVKVRSR